MKWLIPKGPGSGWTDGVGPQARGCDLEPDGSLYANAMGLMKAFSALKAGLTRLLQLLVLLLVLVFVLPFVPIMVGALGVMWVWKRVQSWRYRRGFEARFRPDGKKVVFVYSDSPHWQSRIESEVLPKISDQAVVLNWSERSTTKWRQRPLEVRIFKHWGGSREFNPLAIVFQEDGSVEVIRFWQAYRDYKHGKSRLLQKKEQELFDALGVPMAERPEEGAISTG